MSPMSKIIAQSKMKEKNNECGKELLCSKCRKRVLYHIFRRPAKTVIKDIEKRPLSKLLGVGELTITRYLDGQLPSVKYSNILFFIFNMENNFWCCFSAIFLQYPICFYNMWHLLWTIFFYFFIL